VALDPDLGDSAVFLGHFSDRFQGGIADGIDLP
jgi:hypothetical protein